MKKLLAMSLALVMVLGLCVTVSGAETKTFYYLHDDSQIFYQGEAIWVELRNTDNEPLGRMTHLGDDYPDYENYYYFNVDEGTDFGAFFIVVQMKDGNGEYPIYASAYNFPREEEETLYVAGAAEWMPMIDLPEGFDPNPSAPSAGGGSNVGSGEESKDIDVSAQFKGAEKSTVVSVDLSWEGMEFTYTQPLEEWNPTEHKYELKLDDAGNPVQAGGWAVAEGSGNKISVINHSNVDVIVVLAFTAADGVDVEGTFFMFNEINMNDVMTTGYLYRADQDIDASSLSDEFYFFITEGEIEKETTHLGTITMTITAIIDEGEEGSEA